MTKRDILRFRDGFALTVAATAGVEKQPIQHVAAFYGKESDHETDWPEYEYLGQCEAEHGRSMAGDVAARYSHLAPHVKARAVEALVPAEGKVLQFRKGKEKA
jgi:hypothetical protein